MGAARDLFRQVGWAVHGKPDAYETLCGAAKLWRGEGQPFSAGMAMLRAVDAAWGRPELMMDAHRAALRDFECVVAEQPPASPAALAALYKLWQTLGRALWLFGEEDRDTVRSRLRELESELSQRLLTHFTNSENADNYLVRGIIIATDLDGRWSVQFPHYEVPYDTEQVGEEAILNIPSAFRLFVFGRDWLGAHEIVKARKDALTTPGLMGWRAVTLANVTPGEAVTHFDVAADAFAADTMPADTEESVRRGGFWSGANQQLWAKSFRARARLVESIREPARVKELLGQAVDALVGTESGWHSSEVSKFNVLVKVLFSLVSDPFSFSADDARREYEAEVYRTERALEDQLAMTFISNAADAFRGFKSETFAQGSFCMRSAISVFSSWMAFFLILFSFSCADRTFAQTDPRAIINNFVLPGIQVGVPRLSDKPSFECSVVNNPVANPLVKAHGHRPINSMPRDKLIKIIEGIGAKSPGMANLTRAVLLKILKDAHKRGTIRENPLAAGVDRFKGGSFHSWTDDELSVFEARWPIGTRERLAYALYFYTGQRGSDVARMNRADITSTGIKVIQKKTGVELNIELHPDLINIIRITPSKGLSLIGNKHNGRPIQRAALTALMREAVRQAGLTERCKPHGLRKAALRTMAEGGATGKQIAAVSGHRTTKEIDRYTAAADQTRLARSGIATMPTRTRTEVPSQ